jgi:hypothetical protein
VDALEGEALPVNAYLGPEELRELVGAASSAKAAFFGVTERTLRGWLAGRVRIPAAAARLAIARWRGDLEVIFGPEAAELRINAGELVVPGWRRGLTLQEIRTLWVRIQGAIALQSEVARLERDLERLLERLPHEDRRDEEPSDDRRPLERGPHLRRGRRHRLRRVDDGLHDRLI